MVDSDISVASEYLDYILGIPVQIVNLSFMEQKRQNACGYDLVCVIKRQVLRPFYSVVPFISQK